MSKRATSFERKQAQRYDAWSPTKGSHPETNHSDRPWWATDHDLKYLPLAQDMPETRTVLLKLPRYSEHAKIVHDVLPWIKERNLRLTCYQPVNDNGELKYAFQFKNRSNALMFKLSWSN